MCLQYLRPPMRRPVWIGLRLGITDMQGAIPRLWCPKCGTEVFAWDALQCPRCEKEEKRHVCKKLSQSL